MKTCECGHGEAYHYDRSGRCKGNKGHCGCAVWREKKTLATSAAKREQR